LWAGAANSTTVIDGHSLKFNALYCEDITPESCDQFNYRKFTKSKSTMTNPIGAAEYWPGQESKDKPDEAPKRFREAIHSMFRNVFLSDVQLFSRRN